MKICFALVVLMLMLPGLQASERKAHEEDLRDKKLLAIFGRAKMDTPEDQWAYVHELVGEERYRKAEKAAAALVKTWPDHSLAVKAQKARADLQFVRENYASAFELYQELIEGYAGLFDYEQVISQQYECAVKLQEQEFSSFFGLSSYESPEEAIPLYKQLLENAPHLNIAPEIHQRIIQIYLDKKMYHEAVAQMNLLEQRYPRNELAEWAAQERGKAFQDLAARYPNDRSPLKSAYDAYQHFLRHYPNSEALPEVRLALRDCYNDLARRKFEQAEYYEKRARNPRAALVMYRVLVEQFPDSEWTETAEERILAITNP